MRKSTKIRNFLGSTRFFRSITNFRDFSQNMCFQCQFTNKQKQTSRISIVITRQLKQIMTYKAFRCCKSMVLWKVFILQYKSLALNRWLTMSTRPNDAAYKSHSNWFLEKQPHSGLLQGLTGDHPFSRFLCHLYYKLFGSMGKCFSPSLGKMCFLKWIYKILSTIFSLS